MEFYKINVGTLQGMGSVYMAISPSLQKFNQLWISGKRPEIEWDMTSVRPGKINVSALAFFLAVADRVSKFTGKPHRVIIDWNPTVFEFLDNIGFFDVADRFKLFEWDYPLGGYDPGNQNPSNRIIGYQKIAEIPDITNKVEVSKWKKIHREAYRDNIVRQCIPLFEGAGLSEGLPLLISRSSSEIATNSLLWGRSAAFLGMQRTKNIIFISISDVGIGCKKSLEEKNNSDGSINLNDLSSLVLASFINEEEYGLRRVISSIMDLNGSISLSSGGGEICWRPKIWKDCLDTFNSFGLIKAISQVNNLANLNDVQSKNNGYARNWNTAIRGTRISFSIPLKGWI